MDKKELSGKDLLLALLYSPGIKSTTNEPILGRTKITKMIYLFEKEIYSKFFTDIVIKLPEYKPYYFGPFSKELFDDLRFFQSICLIKTEETNIPITPANKYESSASFDDSTDDEWSVATFEENVSDDVELMYSLSENGSRYVEDKIWKDFSQIQKDNLRQFKAKINSISLDALLNYVYNKYPQDTTKSLIADKYLDKGIDGQC